MAHAEHERASNLASAVIDVRLFCFDKHEGGDWRRCEILIHYREPVAAIAPLDPNLCPGGKRFYRAPVARDESEVPRVMRSRRDLFEHQWLGE
jgi:hypothetical protein